MPTKQLFCQDSRGTDVRNDSRNVVTGKTYALIIGISQYSKFPSLRFADKDARAFKEFLTSKAGGNLDLSDIHYKVNDSAKGADVWMGVSWLTRRADSAGETAIIYFSGHGDAADAEQAYLLAHDAPNEGDPHLYNAGGTFQIYNLKVSIKQMVSKGVKVILITDACRSKDLPGKDAGNRWTFQSITEEKCGEIQMISCSSNEQSLEGGKWGEGRGVFSFHLINGLNGSADSDPKNGQVTLYEIERYVKDKVRNDTRSSSGTSPTQNPVFCCTDKNEEVLSKVALKEDVGGGNAVRSNQRFFRLQDPETSKAMLLALYPDNSEIKTSMIFENPLPVDSSDEVYKLYSNALAKKELIEPKGKSASDYIVLLLRLIKDPVKRADLEDEFVASLVNEAQAGINRFSKPPILDTVDALNYAFFFKAGLLLTKALEYTRTNKVLFNEINSRKLFLEARALIEKGDSLSIASSKIDSSLLLMNTSYGYYTKGMLLREMGKDDEAIRYFEKAAGEQKKWAYPMVAKGDVFRSNGIYDSAIVSYKKALVINPASDDYSFKLGVAFQDKGEYDSSITYLERAGTMKNKSGEQDLNVANRIGYLAKAYYKKGNNAVAESLFKKAISICEEKQGQNHPYYANTLTDLAVLYDNVGDKAAAKPLYAKAARINSNKFDPSRRNSGMSNVAKVPTVRKGVAIQPAEVVKLLSGIASGKNNTSDFAPYLCDNLDIIVRYNSKTMSFSTMCTELRTSNPGKELTVLLTTDNRNCITSMDVSIRKSHLRVITKDADLRVSEPSGNKVDTRVRTNKSSTPIKILKKEPIKMQENPSKSRQVPPVRTKQ